MENTHLGMMSVANSEPIASNNIAIIISIAALLISVLGWGIIHLLNIKATNTDRKNNFQLKIYENILDRSNTLIKTISSYTTEAISHTNAMATILNEYHSFDELPDNTEKIDAIYNLKKAWLDASYNVSEKGFDMQYAIEDYMRYLDMNGTDFTKGTIVYDSLLEVKKDAYDAADKNRKRWNDHKKIETLTPEKYTKISAETKVDADIVFEFGMCVDDVLTLIYNKAISGILSKPPKQLSTSDPRRVITEVGILDNRTDNNPDNRDKPPKISYLGQKPPL